MHSETLCGNWWHFSTSSTNPHPALLLTITVKKSLHPYQLLVHCKPCNFGQQQQQLQYNFSTPFVPLHLPTHIAYLQACANFSIPLRNIFMAKFMVENTRKPIAERAPDMTIISPTMHWSGVFFRFCAPFPFEHTFCFLSQQERWLNYNNDRDHDDDGARRVTSAKDDDDDGYDFDYEYQAGPSNCAQNTWVVQEHGIGCCVLLTVVKTLNPSFTPRNDGQFPF